MPENHLYEYAVIRVVPRVEREEFLNVGVILYCRKHRYLQVIYTLDEQRLRALYAEINIPALAASLEAIAKICRGGAAGGPIGLLDVASRFRWLTATRSTVIQTSKTHAGFSCNVEETLTRLHQQLVG
ncbi:DUF3037 domain-containing protein [Chitinophaga solisilvae]|uniref:DUF3037 domain-containing protein n=1 Tax=Chitinophaga solisilvae TaxID=1233460 RepID=A0A3S1B1E5_9BACT|nr:DUF3037 domain-containing protein [Chitinophaga solisilvae]NSL87337.1 DUF3037 domain-containing protein [Chitinophaga solisilvae]